MKKEHKEHQHLPDFTALDSIKEAEKKASEILEVAQKKREQIVDEAKKQAIDFVLAQEKKALIDREGQISELKKRLEMEKQAMENDNEEKISELKKTAQGKAKKEVPFLVEKFLSEV